MTALTERIAQQAHDRVYRAVKDGTLIPQPCEECGAKAEAHHDDYAKPLDVRWLCPSHHRAYHYKYPTGIKWEGRLTVRVPLSLRDRVDRAARERGISRSELIREAIENAYSKAARDGLLA